MEIAYMTVDDINIITPAMIGLGLSAGILITVMGIMHIISWFKS